MKFHCATRFLVINIKLNNSILKSRDTTLSTKVHLVNAMVFPVVMYECESWTVKKTEHRIDAFQLWCWRRLLGVPWTTRRSNQSILKETSPEYSLEVLMLNLKLWFIYFGPVMWRTNWLEKNWLQCGVLQSKSWLWLSNWTELNFTWRLLNSGVI